MKKIGKALRRSIVHHLGFWRSCVWLLAWINIGSGLTFVKQGDDVAGPGLKVINTYCPWHLEGYGVFLIIVAVFLVVGTQRRGFYARWILWLNMMVYLGQVVAVFLGYHYYHQFSPGFWVWSAVAAWSYIFKKATPHENSSPTPPR